MQAVIGLGGLVVKAAGVAAAVAPAVGAGVSVAGFLQSRRAAKKGAGLPRPKTTEPSPRPSAVEAGERQRTAVFNRLARLRRATRVSQLRDDPAISRKKLGAGVSL